MQKICLLLRKLKNSAGALYTCNCTSIAQQNRQSQMMPGIPCLASTTFPSQGLSQGSRNSPRLPTLSAPSLFPPATPELRLLGNNLHTDSNQARQVPGTHLQEWVTPQGHGSSLRTHTLPILPTMSSLTLQTLTISKARPIKSSP